MSDVDHGIKLLPPKSNHVHLLIETGAVGLSFQPPLKPFDPPLHSGGLGLGTGLYSYSFDSQAAPFRGFTLTVVGRNE